MDFVIRGAGVYDGSGAPLYKNAFPGWIGQDLIDAVEYSGSVDDANGKNRIVGENNGSHSF